MSLVLSLLQAIVSLDGEALVIHVGEKPYVVAPTGQVELATRGLTFEAVTGIVEQLLPMEIQNALDEFGAIQHEIPPRPEFRDEHFTVVAARGGEDVWVEIRRRRAPEDEVPAEMFAPPAPTLAAYEPEAIEQDDGDLTLPDQSQLWPTSVDAAYPTPIHEAAAYGIDLPASLELDMPAPVHHLHLPASIEIDQPPRASLYAVPRVVPTPEAPPEARDIVVPPIAKTPPPPVVLPKPEPVIVQQAPPPPIVTPKPVPVIVQAPPPPVVTPKPVPVIVQQAPPPSIVTPKPVPVIVQQAPPPPIVTPKPEPVIVQAPPPPVVTPKPVPVIVQAPPPPVVTPKPVPVIVQALPPPIVAPKPEPVIVQQAPPPPVVTPKPEPVIVQQAPPPPVVTPKPEPVIVQQAPPPPVVVTPEPETEWEPIVIEQPAPPRVVVPEPTVVQAAPPPAKTPPSIARPDTPVAPPVMRPQAPPPALTPSPIVPPLPLIPPPPMAQPAPPPALHVSQPEPPHPAVVLTMSRHPVRGDAPAPMTGATLSGLDRLLRIAAARGASTLYLASQARPSVRVDGEIQMLDEAALGASDVESLLIDLMPERNREALRSGVGTEWICDVAEVGRVRCMTFRDHRGAGGIFRMMPVRAISADQLGLSREIQALAAEPEGLVLIAGPRSSGKSTLISAFVDLINRTRRDHLITIESEITVVHENRSSLVSQREVRGDNEEMLAVVRAAMRENPDVLVIEELRTAETITLALDAASSGRLVVGALPAHTATGAVDRIIDLYPPEFRRHVQLALAENLRGIVAQVLLRKTGGGRVAAREVLLNTSAVASAIAEGKTSQLPLAMEGGRKHGMVPLNDALVGWVQSGAIEAREAYRRAADRAAFLSALKRHGLDTSFVERLA